MIVFINGSINAGKSTVSKILQERLPKTALVEFDSIRDYIGWLPIDEAIPIVHDVGTDVIKTLVKNEFNVVVPYPLSKKSFDKIKKSLCSIKAEIYAFTLSPKIEKAITNRGARELDQKEIDRIHYHYSIGINNPGFGEVIDNSEQSPEETANEILERIKKS